MTEWFSRSSISEIYFRIMQAHFQCQGPLLVYDLRGMQERMKHLQELSFRHHCRFLFACKSFPHGKVLDLAGKHLAGFDVSNEEEYGLLPPDLKNKVIWLSNPALNSFHGNRWEKGQRQLVVTIETAEQLAVLLDRGLGTAGKETPDLAIRLNTHDLLGIGASTPSSHRFGAGRGDLMGLLKLGPVLKDRLVGFHFHHASERNTLEQYIAMAEEASRLARQMGLELKVLNLGGGLHTLNLPQLEALLRHLRERIPREVELYFEPGRLFSENFGYACGQLQLTRDVSQGLLGVLDLSMFCHLQWSRPELVHENTKVNPDQRIWLYGPTCYENDLIGEFHLQAASFFVGQSLVFRNISGYSWALNKGFNGIPQASVHFLE